jgi:hypothetical protein
MVRTVHFILLCSLYILDSFDGKEDMVYNFSPLSLFPLPLRGNDETVALDGVREFIAPQ